MNWVDDASSWFEKATGDPMAGAVIGTALITAVSDPVGRARYQECRLEVVIEAPGVDRITVQTGAVVRRDHWPRIGMTLPARVPPAHPENVDITWDALPKNAVDR
ncbi:MAG: hypothetical protein KKH75_01740 [Actinobacteria bacterium]|nr:hypothetical protein [Actinomycetota bacterium]